MALVARELKITIGTTVFGKGTSLIIDGKFRCTKSYAAARLEFDVVVAEASESALTTTCTTIEEAMRQPNQLVKVEFNSEVHETWDPSANTGFLTQPSINKVGSPHDTGRSRRYVVAVDLQLPANETGANGRRESQVTLTTDAAGRRRFTVSGVYTALTTNTARAQYEASIGAYAASLRTAFGGTWEGPHDVQASTDKENKLCSFSEVWEEVLKAQSLSATDDTYLRRPQLAIRRVIEAPGDTFLPGQPDALRLETFTVAYETFVDKTLSTDLKGIYTSRVRPYLLAEITTTAGSSALALVHEEPEFDPTNNRIRVAMTVLSVGASTMLFCQVRTDDSRDLGKDLVPVWSGDRLAKHVFQGPARFTRTVTTIRRDLDASGGTNVRAGKRGRGTRALGGGGGGGSDPFGIFGTNKPLAFDFVEADGSVSGGAGVDSAVDSITGDLVGAGPGVPDPEKSPDGGSLTKVFLGESSSVTPLVLGRPGDPQIRVIDATKVERWEYLVTPPTPKTPNRTATGPGASAANAGSAASATTDGGGSTAPNPAATAT